MSDKETWIRAAACGDLADGEALAAPAPDGRTIARVPDPRRFARRETAVDLY